jgi:ferredoxin--NADP+ reductase
VAGQLATVERPLAAAIVGAGPSGFYAAAALLKEPAHSVTVDMFDRLVAQDGLARYGVAPDHQNIKAVAKTFDRTAAEAGFRYFGNVE